MTKERLEQIIENVNRRNIINCACGSNRSESDNEILELLDEINRLKDELYSTNQVVNELLDIKTRNEKAVEYINTHYLNANEPDLLNILTGGDEE